MKVFFIFVSLTACFAFSTKFLNASGFEDLPPLRSKSLTLNEAGIIFYTMEIFRNIKGYEGLYQISNLGRVKSLLRKRVIVRRILSPSKGGWGYYHVTLCKNGESKNAKIHRLVALCFMSNPKNKPEINHKNGIKADNRIENLEWVTKSENELHAYKNGLKKPLKGSLNPNAKLNEIQDRENDAVRFLCVPL